MLLNDFLTGLRRRWYVVVAGFAATVAAAFGVYTVVPVTYEATASVVLIPPEESVAAGDNPYLYLGGLGQALSVMVITMNSAESHDRIIGDRQDVEYTVGQDATTDGPIVGIRSVAHSKSDALALVQSVVDYVPVTLTRLQDSLDVPRKSRIGHLTLAQAQKVEINNRRQLQLIGVAVGGGVVGTLALAAALDRYFLNRRRSKPEEPGPGSGTMQGLVPEAMVASRSDEEGSNRPHGRLRVSANKLPARS